MTYQESKHELPDLTGITATAKELAANVEMLLEQTKGAAGDVVPALRQKLTDNLTSIRERLMAVPTAAIGKAKDTASDVDAYVIDKRWQIIGAAGFAGFVLGYLSRGSSSK